MARHCLLGPGNPAASKKGGWDDYVGTNDALATLKATYPPAVESTSSQAGCSIVYTTTHTVNVIDTNQDHPAIVARSCITSDGAADWVDV